MSGRSVTVAIKNTMFLFGTLVIGLLSVACQDSEPWPGAHSDLGGGRQDKQGAQGGAGGSEGQDAPCDEIACPEMAGCTVDDDGRKQCVCNSGFSGPLCDDIDECAQEDRCGEDASCFNTYGGFVCACLPGFELDEQTNDCVEAVQCESLPCDINASCEEDQSSRGYRCLCEDGFFGDGFRCSSSAFCEGVSCSGVGQCQETGEDYYCDCDVGFFGKDCEQACHDPLSFDPAIEEYIRDKLELVADAPITVSELKGLTSLVLPDSPVVSLTGLQCWASLNELSIPRSLIDTEMRSEALEVLRALSRLKRLDLSGSYITDIAALRDLHELEELNISSLALENSASLDVLRNLTQLRVLDISELELLELPELKEVRGLEVLIASHNHLDQVERLAELPLLRVLDLSETSVDEVSPLAANGHLASLRLGQTRQDQPTSLRGLDKLQHLPFLWELNLDGRSWSAPVDFSTFSALRALSIAGGQLSSLDSLADAIFVQHLSLRDNQIEELSPLVESGFSGRVFLTNNPIDCEQQATQIKQLEDRGVQLAVDCLRRGEQ